MAMIKLRLTKENALFVEDDSTFEKIFRLKGEYGIPLNPPLSLRRLAHQRAPPHPNPIRNGSFTSLKQYPSYHELGYVDGGGQGRCERVRASLR